MQTRGELGEKCGPAAQQCADNVDYHRRGLSEASMRAARVTIWASLLAAIALPAALSLPTAAWADPSTAWRQHDRATPYMRVFGVSQAPYGFVQFCERTPDECRHGMPEEQRFSAGPDRLNELDAVNRAVNREIEAATDMEIYGQTEFWTLPTTRGDCEDYALLKRKRLIARGWPVSTLLLTVARDEKGEGHAVLTARTVQGDFILDNKVDEVKVWSRTRYDYVMRQSYLNPRIWMSLDSREGNANLPLAGVRSAR
jgi:predicted transglutaminase-like cysteine proteinase